ncbi:hypothetical protein ACP70R_021261 [Stipagrostis hirtigluma subsp. patula]
MCYQVDAKCKSTGPYSNDCNTCEHHIATRSIKDLLKTLVLGNLVRKAF